MSPDIRIRIEGCAGRITLDRPKALNALTYAMCLEIEAALDAWRTDPAVALVLIDAEGDRAFCAGGDIAEMYATGIAGDYSYGRRFWRDEYRMNAKLFEYRKPVVSFLQGFVMGGGVGVGCHGSHRIVGETSRLAMPECGIGLVPDVGGSLLLAQAPGRLGDYLGTTGARMGPADAILAGFADHFVPEAEWAALKSEIARTGNWKRIFDAALPAPAGTLADHIPLIDAAFGQADLSAIAAALAASDAPFAAETAGALARGAPLSMACTIEMVRRLRGSNSIRRALELEYRFTHRAMESADFLEGIRAQIIDKDRTPRWRHAGAGAVPAAAVEAMLAPLGAEELALDSQLGAPE